MPKANHTPALLGSSLISFIAGLEHFKPECVKIELGWAPSLALGVSKDLDEDPKGRRRQENPKVVPWGFVQESSAPPFPGFGFPGGSWGPWGADLSLSDQVSLLFPLSLTAAAQPGKGMGNWGFGGIGDLGMGECGIWGWGDLGNGNLGLGEWH